MQRSIKTYKDFNQDFASSSFVCKIDAGFKRRYCWKKNEIEDKLPT